MAEFNDIKYFAQQQRQPNLNMDIVQQPAKFVREGGSGEPSEAVT